MTVLQKLIFDIETGEDSYSATELIHTIEAYFPAEEQQIRGGFEASKSTTFWPAPTIEEYLTHLKTST